MKNARSLLEDPGNVPTLESRLQAGGAIGADIAITEQETTNAPGGRPSHDAQTRRIIVSEQNNALDVMFFQPVSDPSALAPLLHVRSRCLRWARFTFAE